MSAAPSCGFGSGAAGAAWAEARRWRSPLRGDCAALLGTGSRRPTRFVRCAHCTPTSGAESDNEARCARRPRSCAARRHPLASAQALPAALGQRGCSSTELPLLWQRGARTGCGVRGKAPESAGRVARACSAPRDLTCRRLFERSERSERSELGGRATRPSIAGKSPLAATALRRTPQPARAHLCLAQLSARNGMRRAAKSRNRSCTAEPSR